MRVVIDTNLIVSAFLIPNSVPAQVLALWGVSGFQLLMSRELLSEIEDVLSRAKHAPRLHSQQAEIRVFYDHINRRATFPPNIPTLPPFAPDPKDTMILALAIAGAADVIVSGDRKLRELEVYEGIPILSPRDFLDLLENEQDRIG